MVRGVGGMGLRDRMIRCRKTVLLFFCAGVLVTGCSAAAQIRAGLQSETAYQEGLRLYQTKEYARAVPNFQQALALQPDHDDAEALLGWSYYYLGKYSDATRHFRQALVRKPNWEGLHNGLGWSRYRVERYHLALESFRQALAIDARFRDAAVGYAYSLFELGRYAEALPHLDRLTRDGEGGVFQKPSSDVEDVRSRYAWTLFYLGDYDKARQQFAKGIAALPEWSGLHNGLGWTLLRLGDKVQARRSFERAVQLNPGLVDAKDGLAQVRP